MSTALLSIRNLVVDFLTMAGSVRAVDGVSFDIPQARTLALVGESGSGKTVISQAILRILPRVARIKSGSIIFRDPKLAGTNKAELDLARFPADSDQMRNIRGGRISIIFQEPMASLSPLHTIGDQIGEAHQLHMGSSRQEAREATIRMLKLVGFANPERGVDTYPFELSGGMRQRAMIAMALICRPALLIADEPTTALDVTVQAQILKLIKDLQHEFHMAVLMITHDLGIVANLADEVVVLYRGRIVEAGSTEVIFRDPQHPYLKALLNAVPRFDMRPDERLKALREVKPVAGGYFAECTTPAHSGAPLLEVSGLRKAFALRKGSMFKPGGTQAALALRDVSFTVHAGESVGLVGESGCGKTTTAKIIVRAVTPDAGQVQFRLNGAMRDVPALEGEALSAYRRAVQVVFQDPFSSLNPRMTVLDLITEPLVIHNIGSNEERREIAKELMQLVGLDPRFLGRYPHSFSGGQRQRIGIARALALKPNLLICDEPVSALDVSVQAQILNLLKDLQAKLGLSYLFISHNLAVVDYMAERILVMCRGMIVEEAPREQFRERAQHPYTRALLAAVPEPDLDHPMDLDMLMSGSTSDPQAWPEPYRILPETELKRTEIAPGHFVLYGETEARADLEPWQEAFA
ncbi:ABC transporter ATP-binding protein [Rhodoligotrophos defluvii]|uniref:ABC transporter ATP-binding protein n=1 Tax=Rhodoligotrophos defluvii TaxID=2561934 RepID=UPI0010C9A854|nr:ABC transporter ATP-binding protein [Rhodoligotrophos defluvii]